MDVIIRYKQSEISEDNFKKYFRGFSNKGNPFYLIPVYCEEKLVMKMAKMKSVNLVENTLILEFV